MIETIVALAAIAFAVYLGVSGVRKIIMGIDLWTRPETSTARHLGPITFLFNQRKHRQQCEAAMAMLDELHKMVASGEVTASFDRDPDRPHRWHTTLLRHSEQLGEIECSFYDPTAGVSGRPLTSEPSMDGVNHVIRALSSALAAAMTGVATVTVSRGRLSSSRRASLHIHSPVTYGDDSIDLRILVQVD